VVRRVIELNRDVQTHYQQDGFWIFAGHDLGRSVRVSISDDDWASLQIRCGSMDSSMRELERMAALASKTIDDGYGGYFVPVTLR
jgi:hypothetical protein